MALNLVDYQKRVRMAVKAFWQSREAARKKQIDSGKAGQGERSGVTSGKNMDGFIDLVLDLVTHFAYRDNKEIELTTKEYALLEYFMRNKGKILSRSMITQQVWKHNFDPESNIIDVYVKRLRQKIEKPERTQLVQSVRGVGYRMKEPDLDADGREIIEPENSIE